MIMQLIWQVSQSDIDKVKAFVDQHKNNVFVQTRIRRNVEGHKDLLSYNVFWDHHVACLVTTQQRSGPDSYVGKFVKSDSFALNYSACLKRLDSLEEDAQKELSSFHLRRTNTIAKEIRENIVFINENWSGIDHVLKQIEQNPTPQSERGAAGFIQEHLKGFGPKQSRNLLQSLGVTRYEIPIDSRITKWLNKFGFPVYLTATGLGDSSYYNFVSDGFQELAKACDILPCVLDAVIFSSYDNGGWTEENIVW
jgi:hypothetical protein